MVDEQEHQRELKTKVSVFQNLSTKSTRLKYRFFIGVIVYFQTILLKQLFIYNSITKKTTAVCAAYYYIAPSKHEFDVT